MLSKQFRMRMAPTKPIIGISIIHLWINLFAITAVVSFGYFPFINTILRYNKGKELSKPLEPVCQNKCSVSVPRSSVDQSVSSLRPTEVLFVHFSSYNLSLQPSNTTDILDPLNLVWVDSIEAPFLSLDLGFNVYSLTTLSRITHHMKVTVEVEPTHCFKNVTPGCVTANLARAFLGKATKERGVLCYAVNDMNTVNYRCCRRNFETKQVQCDIPAIGTPEMAIIFTAIAIAAAIALLCFPVLFNIVPDKKNSETLYTNSQVHNPLYHLIISTVQALRHYSTEYYCVNVMRRLLIALALPALCYINYGLQWYTETFDIPKMFNDSVAKVWASSMSPVFSIPFAFVSYNSVVVLASFLPRTENRQLSSSHSEPFALIFGGLKPQFGKATDSGRPFCSRLVALLSNLVLILLSPVVIVVIFICFIGHVLPLGKMIRSLLCNAYSYFLWIFERVNCGNLCFCCATGFLLGSVAIFVSVFFMLAFQTIFESSLLLFTNLIVYFWMGLVASKDYYFPRIAVFAVFVYYSWNCLSSVKSRYQILLEQTFKKCKKHQEKQSNGRKALIFDEEGVPRISSELFQHVIDRILPRSVVYTNMILKLTIIILFLCLTFSSILIYGKSNLDESTQALAVFLTGLLPKLIEVFGEGSSCRHLCEMENACRVEKIVKDFLNQSDDDNSDNWTTMSHDEEQPPHPSGGQSDGDNSGNGTTMSHDEEQPPLPSGGQARTNLIDIRDQPTLKKRSMPKPVHSIVRSKKPSKGNNTRDKNLLVVQADVNPRVQNTNGFNSEDLGTERTPLLVGHWEKRDRNGIE